MLQQQGSASLIMKTLAAGICATLAVYWPAFVAAPTISAALLRPILLGSAVLMGLCLLQEPLTASEIQNMKLFGAMWLIFLLTSVTADDPLNALVGFAKIVLIQLFALLMARALRHGPSARVLGTGMFLASIFISLFILYAYLKMVGLTLPTYAAVRGFKGVAEKQGYALNETPATAIMAFICSACLRPMTRFMWGIGALIVIIGSVLTGSRAALAMPILAAILLLTVVWSRSQRMSRRFFAIATLVLIFGGTIVAMIAIPSQQLVSLSEGRWDLWRAGISKFLERPLFGWGFQSWKDDLVSRLPGEYRLTAELAKNIIGGYHNQFVQVLSEHGIAGFIALTSLYVYSFRAAAALAFRKTLLWKYGLIALYGVLFMLVRANVELDGFFGFAQDPVDYTAYLFLAILVSRLSLEETATQQVAAYWRSRRLAAAAASRVPRHIPVVAEQSPLGGA